ncbi:MAG: hypothetical protein Q9182_002793 [Xanthomendoza sp. 2 TL-2023]
MVSPTPCDLHHRVRSWLQEVNRHVDHVRQSPLLPQKARRATASGMKLRDRPAQKPLAEISINIPTRKRKRAKVMADSGNVEDANNAQPAQKKRGRPPKPKNNALAAGDKGDYQEPDQMSAPLPPASIPTFPLPLRSPARSPSKSPARSPTKRGAKAFHGARPRGQIEATYLARCTPAIWKYTFRQLRAKGKVIPQAVLDLYEKLQLPSHGCVPEELRNAYDKDFDTPRKSREPIGKPDYLESFQTPFSAKQCARLKETIEMVLLKAERNARLNAHERQWGAVVNQILCEVELWSNGAVALFNIENCPIGPDELKPLRPNSGQHIDEALQSTSSKSDTTENINRMVDWSLGLELGLDDAPLIQEAYKMCSDNEQSLNQTLAYVEGCPLFLDLEIKKANTARSPEVQLATWAAAGILKKRHHGWNSNMIPTLAIAVDGHEWCYYIIFELAGEIIMTEAAKFGDTRNHNGVWTIFHRLANVSSWAQTEYAQWVQDAIVGWAKGKIQQNT